MHIDGLELKYKCLKTKKNISSYKVFIEVRFIELKTLCLICANTSSKRVRISQTK